ncbi:TrbC/VirB2 family protein [Sphingomonas psychrolutea]|uniref:TrbC/VIRB2 family protein n=1 Tax=Sphingomonas psychrolutea TaxID=1259676 RepID=A0ABQ1H7X7_9SPHN|nr:TrbC/VirB2 family protein [Sphingomonas psychrolutea]GGA61413.1 hypothetical protein GCM10011395_34720 [Sphingomonas psychrolutea]
MTLRLPFANERTLPPLLTAAAAAFLALPAYAAGSSMPWEAPLQSILESIEGPVAKIVAVIIIIVTGLTLAFGDRRADRRRQVSIARNDGDAVPAL